MRIDATGLDARQLAILRGAACSIRTTSGILEGVLGAHWALQRRCWELGESHQRLHEAVHVRPFTLSWDGGSKLLEASFTVRPKEYDLQWLMRTLDAGEAVRVEVRCVEVSPGHLGFVVDSKSDWSGLFEAELKEWAEHVATAKLWLADVNAGRGMGFTIADFFDV